MFYEIMHRESCVAQLSTTGECRICLEDFMPCDLVLVESDDFDERINNVTNFYYWCAYKGQWEFPGGKIEPGETPQQALKREIEEELDTEIAVEDLIGTIEYDYPAFHLSMDCFWCEVVSGDLVLKEAEAARWLTKEEFDSVPWLPADQTILDVIRSSMQPVKPLHTSEYDKEPLQRC